MGNWVSSECAGIVTPPVSSGKSCANESVLSTVKKQSDDICL